MRCWPLLAAAAAAAAAGPAAAQAVVLTPLIDVRLRWEQVDQADLPLTAEALTARVRSGLAAGRGRWQALVEGEATLAIVPTYNSGVNGRTRYPLVGDPGNVELNRAQLCYAAPGLAATAGRQVVELADQRFVGSMSRRQNQQSFDAARVQLGDPERLFADLTYAWSARTTAGIGGTPARPQAIGGDDLFALAGAATPAGTLTGFAYLVDEDQDALQHFALSSRTLGVRLAGRRALGRRLALGYAASWARQANWHRNPNRYAATYWLAEGTLTAGRVTATAGQEVLGAADGRLLTSVQTPLGSLFRFNGWAGRFTTTPPDGLRDRYATGALAWPALGPFTGATVSATWHRFGADRAGRRYGDEVDLLAGVKRGRAALSARLARYRADGFAADTTKAWLEADWTW